MVLLLLSTMLKRISVSRMQDFFSTAFFIVIFILDVVGFLIQVTLQQRSVHKQIYLNILKISKIPKKIHYYVGYADNEKYLFFFTMSQALLCSLSHN